MAKDDNARVTVEWCEQRWNAAEWTGDFGQFEVCPAVVIVFREPDVATLLVGGISRGDNPTVGDVEALAAILGAPIVINSTPDEETDLAETVLEAPSRPGFPVYFRDDDQVVQSRGLRVERGYVVLVDGERYPACDCFLTYDQCQEHHRLGLDHSAESHA